MKTFQIRGGDLVVGLDGRLSLITGQPKLTQDVIESLMVGRTSEGYGAGLGDMVGTLQDNVPHLLMLNIFSAMEYYQSLQALQPNLSPSERLAQVTNIYTQKVPGSRRDSAFVISIQNGQDPAPARICLLQRPSL